MKASELFVKCLENEGVETIFGIPGEENIDVMDVLLDSPINFVTTRHEQGAAFMADVHGRLTGQAGVCLATLGPGATNLVTGVADANMDNAPVVAIAGQADTTRLHKESHQVLNLVDMYKPITKYSTQIIEPSIIPEVVRKAFKVSQTEKPGACFIDFPENIAQAEIEDKMPLKVQAPTPPWPSKLKVQQAVELIAHSKNPIILAGNGVVRMHASDNLIKFAEALNIPVATTFMAKGVIPSSHSMALGTVGLQSHDYVSCGFDHADVIICVGFDMVEYHPYLWHKNKDKKLIHIDELPAEIDEHYILACGVIGDIGSSLDAITAAVKTPNKASSANLREVILDEMSAYANDQGYPIKPQKIVWDLRQVLRAEDIVISDVGAHKMWMARMYQAEQPNTCIISNGFASMGISVPGAMAAKMAFPQRNVVAVTGDAGFLMNVQEIETALRVGAAFVILVWTDREYGLITWKQKIHFGRESYTHFNNPDFVKLAESFGAKGYRVEQANELVPVLKKAIQDNTVVVVDCPVDYKENMKLTEKLGNLVCKN